MFNQTITIYHRTEDPNGECWARKVLDGVYFVPRTGKKIRRDGMASDGGGSLIIPRKGHSGYLPPGEWSGEGWTFAPGDWFLVGACFYEIERSPSELFNQGEPHVITAIKLLALGEMAHWKVWCDGSQP